LFLVAADFSGAISGALSLEAAGVVTLSGTNTYTGTTTIDSGDGVELGAGGTTGSIGGGAIIDKGTLFIFRSNAITLANAISGAGVLWQTGSGVTSINTANTYTGGTKISAGTLAIGNGGALGTGTLSQSAGELLATANETLTNALTLSGSVTFAAAHGTTLTEKAPSYSVLASSTLNFGAPGQDGTVIWGAINGSIASPFPAINVQAGTLKGVGLSFLLDGSPISVAAGATLDFTGNSTEFAHLTGGGSIIDSGVADTLTLGLANFSGVISGPLSLVADDTVILSGKNTYTGTTTIEAGVIFQLGGGATIGGGAIVDGGTFAIDDDSAVTLANAISGSGNLEQFGDGVTSINAANTYTGGTTILAGTLAIGKTGALGAGTVSLSGGELLATANETLTNALSLSGTSTIAAAHGTTLNVDESTLTIAAHSTLNIGSVGEDGTVLWHTSNNGSSSTSPFLGVHVQAGTLKDGDGQLSFLLDNAAQTTIDAGARIDLAGFDTDIVDLVGAGAVIDSGASATLTLDAANFSGTISGALKLFFNGDATLSGLEDYTGGATLDGPITVTNAGTYDLVANTNITGAAGSSFVNNGVFEKAGGGGISLVASNFVNNGTLNVLGPVTPNPGLAWKAIGTGDFNGDGFSDILFQNTTSGQVSIWERNGNALIGGGPVSPNPGPSWRAIGTGDFNDDGRSDILFQNTTSGQVSIWEMNGSTLTGGGPVSPNPGPSWHAIGTGDFNGDGHSDILFQNASGQASIWEMNGNSLVGGGPVSPNPGPSWRAVA
jgi:fibronectin-binding autotransporter adhesin